MVKRSGLIARKVSLRRRPSRDPVSSDLRNEVLERDHYACVLRGMSACAGYLELDHVRSSGALGKRSRSTVDNLATLCTRHHEWKTTHGREARPILLAYLAAVEQPEHTHVDPQPGCLQCFEVFG